MQMDEVPKKAGERAAVPAVEVPELPRYGAALALEEVGSRGDQVSAAGDLVTAACMLGMGASTFPITETLLLQTAMYTKCWGWGGFYGLATVTLFLPGLVVQVAQNRWDQLFDLKYGTRRMGAIRLLFGHGLQLIALVTFLAFLHTVEPGTHSSAATMVLICTFVMIGLGCSIVYGTVAQLISIFPSRLHPYFFIGTYSVSAIIAPFNIALGTLYSHADSRAAGDASAYDCDGGHGVHWTKIVMYYSAGFCFELLGLLAFWVLCCVTQFGVGKLDEKDSELQAAALSSAAKPSSSKRLKKDLKHSCSSEDLFHLAGSHMAVSAAAGQQLGGGSGAEEEGEGRGGELTQRDLMTSIDSKLSSHLLSSPSRSPRGRRPSRSRSQDGSGIQVAASSPSIYDAGGAVFQAEESGGEDDLESPLDSGAVPESPRRMWRGDRVVTESSELEFSEEDFLRWGLMPEGFGSLEPHSASGSQLVQVWCKCLPIGCIMVLALAQNLLICGEYDSLPLHLDDGTDVCGDDCIESLHTVMMYDFYAMQCLGSITVMIPAVSRRLNSTVLLCLAVLRMPFWPMIVYYNTDSKLAHSYRAASAEHGNGGMLVGGTVGGGGAVAGSVTVSDVADQRDWFGSDYNVVLVYSFVQWTGGVIFSRCFSVRQPSHHLPTCLPACRPACLPAYLRRVRTKRTARHGTCVVAALTHRMPVVSP